MQHQLDHEKLDVYRIELEFIAWATDLMVELSESASAKTRRISETLDRFSPPPQVHEAPTPYAIEDEDEDEDETSNQGH